MEFFPETEDFTALDWLEINAGEGEIHIMALAEAMWDAMNETTPRKLKGGEYHIPFGDNFDVDRLIEICDKKHIPANDSNLQELMIKIATARCARISYNTFEGKNDYRADIKLHNRLASMGHWSPFEHCGRAMTGEEFNLHVRGKVAYDGEEDNWEEMYVPDNHILGWSGNFRGFIQYRHLI